MSVTEPLGPSKRPAVAGTPDLEAVQPRPADAWLECPYTDAKIDEIFDA